MTAVIDGYLYAWKKNEDYGPKLVADLTEEQMVLQPVRDGKPANHPAWVFSHLNAYLPVIEALIQGKEFDDPKEHRFGMLSKPEQDRGIYASKEALIDEFVTGHQQIAGILAGCDDSIFEQAVELPRWKQVMPTVGIALPYVMFNHENLHLGQLSAWRRIQGMPSV